MNFKQEKFLVTGGAGFIGSNLAKALLKRGAQVKILDNFSTGKKENISEIEKDLEIIEGDIRHYHSVEKSVKGVSVVFHEAALPSVPRSIKDPIASNETNINGLLNVLNASKENKVRRVVFASSSSIYGDNPILPKHEGMIPGPLSPYAVTKLTGEHYLKVFSNLYGLETIALRYFNVFGPHQDPNSYYSAVIPKFIKAILENRSPEVFGDGTQSRDFTYIDNVVEGNLLAAMVPGKTGLAMNCACHDRITLNELIEKINGYLEKSIPAKYSDPRKGDIKHSFADITLIKNELNYKPLVSFDEGLSRTIEWFIKNENSKLG